jgi:hypothetical protein
MEFIKLPQPETQIVVDAIVKAFSACTIFAFGYRSKISLDSNLLLTTIHNATRHHFDLLVFYTNPLPNGGSIVANKIAESTNGTITATVLLHKVTDLSTKQASQQWFFDTVLRNGQRLHLDTTAPPYLLNHKPTRDVEGDIAYWHKCVAVAQFHLHAAADSEQLDVTLCKIALLHTTATQIALGLLRVFLGYTPNEFGLHYLLRLCGTFTVLPSQLFPQRTPMAIRSYKMLCAPPSMLRHWTRLNSAEPDFVWLLDACTNFLQLAAELVAPELERLGNTQFKSETL